MEQPILPSKKDTQSLATINNLAATVLHINQLTPFPYSDLQIFEWAKSINELTPELTPDILKKIIDKFKLGIYEFDSRAGIQNVFKGYKLILGEKIHSLTMKNIKEWDAERQKQIEYYNSLQNKVTPKQQNYNSGLL